MVMPDEAGRAEAAPEARDAGWVFLRVGGRAGLAVAPPRLFLKVVSVDVVLARDVVCFFLPARVARRAPAVAFFAAGASLRALAEDALVFREAALLPTGVAGVGFPDDFILAVDLFAGVLAPAFFALLCRRPCPALELDRPVFALATVRPDRAETT